MGGTNPAFAGGQGNFTTGKLQLLALLYRTSARERAAQTELMPVQGGQLRTSWTGHIGSYLSGAPASTPVPVTTLSTPGGRPTSCAMAASSRHVTLANSDGFRTAVLPAAKAGATFHCKTRTMIVELGLMGELPLPDHMFGWCCDGTPTSSMRQTGSASEQSYADRSLYA
jgi:hypothetical protein